MQTKHTPGPWAAFPIPNDRLKRYAVVCVNDDHCTGTGKLVVAEKIRTKHNASLIAAAPELLAALQAVLPVLDCAFEYEGDVFGILHNDAVDARQLIRTAIAHFTSTAA